MGHYVDMEAPISDADYFYLCERGMKYAADQVRENYGRVGEQPVVPEGANGDELPPYAEWTVAELKKELDSRDIEYDSRAVKADLVQLLDEDDATNPES